jgi:type III restriction enzyme
LPACNRFKESTIGFRLGKGAYTYWVVPKDSLVEKYNPDWAFIKEVDQTLYLVRETKGTLDLLQLRTSETDKVRCGKKHIEALDVPFDIVVSANEV